jgi:hypothetical protein
MSGILSNFAKVRSHGDDFKMIDPEFVLETFPEFLSEVLMEMSGNLDEEKIYRRSFKEYKDSTSDKNSGKVSKTNSGSIILKSSP